MSERLVAAAREWLAGDPDPETRAELSALLEKNAEGELAEAEKKIPAEFREDYRRVIRAKGAEGMARMEAGVCEGCGQQVTRFEHFNSQVRWAVSSRLGGRVHGWAPFNYAGRVIF